MKRVLSLVLALVLVLGMIPMGFAADATAGQMLKGYGIIVGDETGNLNEDQNLNRAEMMVVLARMMGKGAEAEAFALPSTFTDLAGFGWAVPWIAYAEMNDWTEGVGANMFNPAGNVTAQEAAVFMLKALGYEADVDFNWTNAVDFATAKGLFVGVDTAATSPILRGDLFTMMITTLNTEVKSGAGKLGIVLGYMEVEELEVVSVKALNLAQVEVKFNMAVEEDTAEKVGNYTLTDEDGDDLFTQAFVAELQDDEKTVIISHFAATAAGDVDQQTEAILEIDGVEAKDNEEMFIDEYVSDVFEYGDITIPKAVKAEVVGIDTIKVTFSEPIVNDPTLTTTEGKLRLPKGDFEVDGGDYIINYVEFTNKQQTEANVVLYSDLDEGKVSIEVSGMEDYAGFNVVKTTFELNVVEDNDAPTVVGYKDATRSGVTLVFNEDIEELFDNDDYNNEEDYFYHTNSSNTVDTNGWEILGNELTLDFDGSLLPEGTAYVYVVSDAVQDLWDNANDKIVTKVEITVDNTAPVVKDIDTKLVEATAGDYVEVKIEFSEDIDAESDFDDAFLIIDKDGDEVDFTLADEDDNDEIIILELDAATEGTFKLTIQDLEDMAGNEIVKVTQELVIEDLTAPLHSDFSAVLYNVAGKNQMIKVDFDEPMAATGAYSVLDVEKYMILRGTTLIALEDLDIVPTLKLVDDGEAVEITVKSKTVDNKTDGFDLAAGDKVVVGRVADAAGNKSVLLSDDIKTTGEDFVYIDVAEVTGESTVVVTFTDRLSKFVASELAFSAGTTPLVPTRISTTVNSDNETVVTVKFAEKFTTNGEYKGDPVVVTVVGTTTNSVTTVQSENIYGESLKLADDETADDAYAPEIAEYTTDSAIAGSFEKGDQMVEIVYASTTEAAIYITFTEDIAPLSVSRLAFSVVDANVDTFAFDGYEYVSDVLVLNITAKSGKTFDTAKGLTVTQNYVITDTSKNEFKSTTTLKPFVMTAK